MSHHHLEAGICSASCLLGGMRTMHRSEDLSKGMDERGHSRQSTSMSNLIVCRQSWVAFVSIL